MSRYDRYIPVSLQGKPKSSLTIDDFRGVDFSEHKFEVDSNHAIDMKNFVFKDGILQKREGFEEILKINNTKYRAIDFNGGASSELRTNTTNFNGIWKFIADDKEEHIIAHVGHLLYEVKNIKDDNVNFYPIYNSSKEAYEFLDQPSFAFVGGKKLWFLGGNKYMVISFKEGKPIVEPVDKSLEVFVPTTSISISYSNALVDKRTTLDASNLLTEWRKNKLISGIGKDDNSPVQTKYFEYTLDSPLVSKNSTQDLVNGKLSNETLRDLSKIHVLIEERGKL